MPTDAWITLAVLVVTVAIMVTDRYPVVMVIGSAVATLMFVGVVDEQVVLSGFSSSAPATVGALYVVAGAAAATGALGGIVERVLRCGPRRGLLQLTGTVTLLSGFMPNTPLVALFAPRVVRWARRTGNRASHYLLPLSFASILGGVITLIGTSTNLIVSDLLRASGEEPLGMFEITPVGIPVAAAGLVLLTLVAHRLLPDRDAAGESMREAARRFHVVMTVDADGPLVGQTVAGAGLRSLSGVYLAAVERQGRVMAAHPDHELRAGDELFFVGDIARVIDLADIDGLTSAENTHVLDTEQPGTMLYEVVLSQQSSLVGRTLKDVGFRTHYQAAVLAVHRVSGEISGKLGSIELRSGDVLLVLAGPGFGTVWRDDPDFALIASVDEPPPARRSRAWLVTATLIAMVVAATTDLLTLFQASVAAAALVVIGGAMSLGEARRAVNLNVVLTIALSISLGGAVAESGLAAQVASAVAAAGEPLGDFGLIAAVLIATLILTEVLTNNAAAAIMLPVALAMAADASVDPRPLAIAVLIGGSCSFLSPIGYQTNLMVYGLGGYRFTDFTKVGLPVAITAVVVGSASIWAFVW